jgi:hypothetical protein
VGSAGSCFSFFQKRWNGGTSLYDRGRISSLSWQKVDRFILTEDTELDRLCRAFAVGAPRSCGVGRRGSDGFHGEYVFGIVNWYRQRRWRVRVEDFALGSFLVVLDSAMRTAGLRALCAAERVWQSAAFSCQSCRFSCQPGCQCMPCDCCLSAKRVYGLLQSIAFV